MKPAAHEFHIVTEWRIAAQIGEVATILTDPEHFADWWGDVYLAVTVLDRGNERGVGGRVAVHSKGWLPYHLHWTGTMVAADLPHSWQIEATGDLTGRGAWRLEQQGEMARVMYDWRVSADRPLFRLLSPLLWPVFAWNHRWAMARGAAGLAREVLRRRQAAA